MLPKDQGTTVRRVLNLIGVFLIHLPSRPLLYLGNLAVYVPSYVILHTGQLATHEYEVMMADNDTLSDVIIPANGSSAQTAEASDSEHGIQESWFVPVFSTAWMFGVFLSGCLAHYIRARFVIGLGIIFQSGSLFISYYTIDVSEDAFFVTLCIFIGFGAGLYEGLLLKNYVVVRLNKRTGTVTSIVLSSGPLGGVIINQFITWYTNPDNLSPDKKLGEMRIFSQESIQEKIPPMFLILGGVMFGLTTIGYFMLSESQQVSKGGGGSGEDDVIDDTEEAEEKSRDIGSLPDDECRKMKNEFGGHFGDDEELGNETLENDSEDLQATLYTQEYYESGVRFSSENVNQPIVSMTPLELLKSIDFYKVAVVYIFGSSARLFLSVYYKVYGQEWIQDDHFLTNLATAMSFLAIFTTVVWGLVLDRIGLKLCFIVIYAGIFVLFLLMYFCAQLNKWAYFFVTLSNSSFVNYLYPVFTIAIIKWFGRNFLSAKLGIVEIFSTAGYILATFVLDGLMEAYGYLSGFIWTSSVHLIGLIIIVISFPNV